VRLGDCANGTRFRRPRDPGHLGGRCARTNKAGALDSLKVEGVVYVLLDATYREKLTEQSAHNPGHIRQLTVDQSELVGEMRDQINWLHREVERKDTIIMSVT
jgi:hypothetical protein